MNIEKYVIIILGVLLIVFSTTVYALNYSNDTLLVNKSEGITKTPAPIENFSKKLNLEQYVYFGGIKKDGSERVSFRRRLSDFQEVQKSENKNQSLSNKVKVIDVGKKINLTYDKKISERFNKSKNSTVTISVKLRDESNIIINGTFEERDVLINQKGDWFNSTITEFLSNFSKEEFNLTGVSTRGFRGNITQKGFNELLKDSRVSLIKDRTDAALITGMLDESVSIINVDTEVWNLGYTGDGIKVCVIDSGIDTDHPDLSGNIVDEKCYCSNNCCPNNQDVDDSAEDDNGHGTHVAGIIASQDSTYKGVAYDVDLYIVKVLDSNNLLRSHDDMDDAIIWCEDRGVDIISMSIGTNVVYTSSNCPSWSDAEINSAYNSGIFIDASSGNDYSTLGISYPACSENVTSVGSSSEDDTLASYTNRKSGLLDLLAPGGSLIGGGSCSTTDRICSTYLTGIFMGMTGTSMAAPHVAGAAALLLEMDSSLSPSEIKNVLVDTGTEVDGYPRINVLAAIDSFTENETEGQVSNCSASGYESCLEYEYGDCDVKLATNTYADNTISWGEIYDNSDPYVLEEYVFGWHGLDSQQVYYDVEDPNGGDCYEGGCDGTEVNSEDTMAPVSAPGTASREVILAYDDTESYWCWVYFYDFDPNYGGDNLLYVLNCFDDGDCSASQYCDKSSSWSNWDCVSKKSDGQSCTLDTQCLSNYCDNDDVGLSDDGWCFTPYNTYFDGQETTKCEISAGSGIPDCDERQVGDDLNLCSGIAYYEEECSSSCGYTDVTSIFECTETGCSCSQALCDGLMTGSFITTCSAGETYFADKCTSTAGGEDRGYNICRSSSFVAGCSADSRCNGVTANTGRCFANCSYDTIPYITAMSPSNNTSDKNGYVEFTCSSTDDSNLANMTLYGNFTGSWNANETKTVTGISNSTTFSKILEDGTYSWTCLVYDNDSQSRWYSENYSITVDRSIPFFIVENSTGGAVAWFDGDGNLSLKGNCSASANCVAPNNSFIVQNSNYETVAYISMEGNLCIEDGDCSDLSATCNPSIDAFIIQNHGINISYIDFGGDLCLTGDLNEYV